MIQKTFLAIVLKNLLITLYFMMKVSLLLTKDGY